ncbi:hypothetical protein KNO15_12310 [Leifsonia shinshuensis]|uniref:O-antigen ligase family protein n=1 Tax=Leifsonia shinshuensis TaxID=150026 RepID=UPI001F5076EC|nr:hypothetical protein [Leifsonia shinshuensis]MCI0157476.1 hypothetical protein [Leifsonia shinshuensis]
MNPLLLLAGGAAVLLVGAVFTLMVPPRVVRAVALSLAFFLLTYGGNNTAPSEVWQACFIGSIALLTLALLRSRAPAAGGRQFVLISVWWGWVGMGVLLTGSLPLTTMTLYFGLAVLAAYVASSLDPAELRILYAAIVLTAIFQMLLGLAEVLVDADPVWGYRGGTRDNPFLDGYDRTQGTLGHPIPFAVLQGIAFIVAWSNPAQWKQRWRLAALACLAVGLVIGGTRSVMLSLVGALLVHLASNGKLTSWVRTLYVLLASGVVLVNVDVGIVRIAEELVVSGSWSHRLGAFESVPNLLARPPLEAWFGSGFGSVDILYDRGYMQQTYLRVVDDMFVYALGTMGIAGLILLVVVSIVAFIFAGRTTRALLVLMIGMFFSFDVFAWMYTGILFSVFVTLPAAAPRVEGLKVPEKSLVAHSA